MLKKIMLVGLAAGAVALNAPIAQAGHATFDCGFNTIAQETATGGQDTFTGVAYGYVVGDAGEAVSISCVVRVDGAEADSTGPSSGTTVATTSEQVTYTATEFQDVKLCARATTSHGTEEVCGEVTTTQIPPQAVIDLIDAVFQAIADATAGLDPLICDVLQAAGAPDVIDSTTSITTLSMDAEDCDLYVGGERFIDFVPYEDPETP